MRIGIDTGGTFTDLVVLAEGGGRVHKVPSTPDDPLRAILAGLRELCPEGLAGAEVVHGTTVGTNAFLTRRGARVVLLTTAGFEDVLFIGRQTRAELFSLCPSKPPNLLPREQVVGVAERLGADGAVVTRLEAGEVERVCRRVQELAPESLAICLLHAYANPEHEERLAQALAPLGVPFSLSSRILPEYREFERTSATVLNAYLAPVLSRYLAAWQREAPEVPLFIQQSSGGFLPARRAKHLGLATILSGPAGGVYAAWRLARELGEDRLLTLDMGGTSTDAALVAGELPFTSDYELQGYPLGLRVLDIHTVGAGGGSIARRDRGGALRVGPESAGADPGPACYGRGQEVTVTDAQLFLGRLVPEVFLGGRLQVDLAATQRAMAGLAREFGVSPRELALGITRVANSHMAKALARVSLERGYDPRDFTLVCFGGAGGLHVCELAEELDVRRIVLPAQGGVLSALGMAQAGLRRDLTRTLLWQGRELTWERLQSAARDLMAAGLAELAADGLTPADFTVAGDLELRYRGQSSALTVPLGPGFREDFHARHQTLYGHAWQEGEVEAVVLRLHFLARERTGELMVLRPVRMVRRPQAAQMRRVVLPGGDEARVPSFWRAELSPGRVVAGPALILEDFATHLVAPGFQGRVAPGGHLLLVRGGAGEKIG
jgi:N-methylhydantoinase A